MTPERYREVKGLFQTAIERPRSERGEYVREAVGADGDLLAEVLSLLAAHEDDSFIEHPAAVLVPGPGASAEEARGEVPAPSRIGPYRVEREVGRGGMGTVYLAVRDDDAFRKEVAIKLIKRGMDTDVVVRRFRNERQILAQLDHPGIAKLLDGGTTDDRPYLVMEHVSGRPITEYCEKQGLDLASRLKLFRRVCAAVTYAHQNLVVHRDLKPGNILVSAEGHPKLLDFGIAKMLESAGEGGEATVTALRMLTPEYASPEQVKGLAITTASDVYSLGVLLYELLTRRRPYRLTTRSPEEVARAVCDQEPERPSAAGQKDLAGDLDTIILKALQKDPARRYASVEQLSEDLRRHLEGHPVLARPDTLRYRAGKFVKRHRAGVAAAVVTAVSLAAGLGGALWQGRVADAERKRAEAERAKAQERFDDVRKLAGSLIFEIHDSVKTLTGASQTRRLLAQRAVEYLDGLARDASGSPGLQRELAEAYIRLGEIQGLYGEMANLGDTQGAIASFQKAVGLARAASVATQDRDPVTLTALATAYDRLGRSAHDKDPVRALEQHEEALHIREKLAGAKPGDETLARAVVRSHLAMGDACNFTGDLAAAYRAYSRALTIAQGFTGPGRDETLGTLVGRLGFALERLSVLVSARLRDDTAAREMLTRALEAFRKSATYREAALSARPDEGNMRGSIGDSYRKIAETCARLGDVRCFRESYERSLALFRRMSADDPGNQEARHYVAESHERRALFRMLLGDPQGALSDYERVFPAYEEAARKDPANLRFRRDLSNAHERRAEVLVATGKPASAERDLRTSLAERERLLSESRANARYLVDYEQTLTRLAELLHRGGRGAEAAELTRGGLSRLRSLAAAPDAKPGVLGEYAWLALLCEPTALRQPDTALVYAQEAVRASGEGNPDLLTVLAVARFLTGDRSGARTAAAKAYALLPHAVAGRNEAALFAEIEVNLARHGRGRMVAQYR